jgi:hypothetical protein
MRADKTRAELVLRNISQEITFNINLARLYNLDPAYKPLRDPDTAIYAR